MGSAVGVFTACARSFGGSLYQCLHSMLGLSDFARS